MPACTSSFIAGLEGHAPLGRDELVELWHVLSTVPAIGAGCGTRSRRS